MSKIVTATLALQDGTIFEGVGFGAVRSEEDPTIGEVVFNTSMYGYQEILTDPSYRGQIMTFTYPHIGNVGCNGEDTESREIHIEGVVIRNQSLRPSNFRSEEAFDSYLSRNGIPGISKIDTRKLVKHIRDVGAQMGAIAFDVRDRDSLVDRARQAGSMLGKDYVSVVSCKQAYSWNEGVWQLGKKRFDVAEERLSGRPHCVALDCGIKHNILRLLVDSGFRVSVVPAFSSADFIRNLRPEALFLSNGPGDPAALQEIVANVRELIEHLPTFGICLGHQILAQALGGRTYKLKFGHRGGNHPVMNLENGVIEITVQNHGFAVDDESLQGDVVITHQNLNDGTVEGLKVNGRKLFSIQYHPEASPGPHDARYLFQQFYEMVVSAKEK